MMKRLVSVFLIVTLMMSAFVVSSVSTAAASNSETVAVTHVGIEKNGYVNVSWRALSYCKYYRVFYKINNNGWVKVSDVHFASQGNYYPGQVMKKSFTVPLYRIPSGNANTNVKIYVTVRGMDRDKRYNTSFRSYQVCSNQLQAFAPRMYLSSVESARATFTIFDPSNIDTSTKFRVFYRVRNNWKPIGDYYKNNLRNKFAVVTLNVPLYKVNNVARFTVRGINSSGQYTTPFLQNAVVADYPNPWTFNMYRLIAG